VSLRDERMCVDVLNFCVLEYDFMLIPVGKRKRHDVVLLLYTRGAYRFETSAIFLLFFTGNVLIGLLGCQWQ
jgi:hypothetical protein